MQVGTVQISGSDRTSQTGPFVGITPFGGMSASTDASVIFIDTYDGATLDTTNKWTAGGTVPPTLSATGFANVNPGTAPSASSSLVSQYAFVPSGYILFASYYQIEAGATALGNHRFFGIGTQPGSWTALTPLQDADGYEIDTFGILRASVYSSGVRISSTVLSNILADGNPHILFMHYRPGATFFAIDDQNSIIGSSFAFPSTQTLPLRVHSINGLATTTGTPTTNLAITGVLDYSRPASANSDGLYPWRRQTVGPRGDGVVSLMDGNKTTYSASVNGLVGLAGDIFTIFGSATKTIRVTRIEFSGVATAAADMDVFVIKRSTADTAGTAVVATPHDSTNAAATAVVNAYSAAPTPGTQVGTPLRGSKTQIGTATAQAQYIVWDFGMGPNQGIVLRGVAQCLALNVNATQVGALYDISVMWTEE